MTVHTCSRKQVLEIALNALNKCGTSDEVLELVDEKIDAMAEGLRPHSSAALQFYFEQFIA